MPTKRKLPIYQPIRTHAQVARIMTERGHPITPSGVQKGEERALEKLRRALMGIAVR